MELENPSRSQFYALGLGVGILAVPCAIAANHTAILQMSAIELLVQVPPANLISVTTPPSIRLPDQT
jgi:hypothetical protein